MSQIVKINGKDHIRIGNKMVEVDRIGQDGKPVVKCWSEEKPNATGGMDCTVHVPCFQIAAEAQKPT